MKERLIKLYEMMGIMDSNIRRAYGMNSVASCASREAFFKVSCFVYCEYDYCDEEIEYMIIDYNVGKDFYKNLFDTSIKVEMLSEDDKILDICLSIEKLFQEYILNYNQ